jgi:hypothetical protein
VAGRRLGPGTYRISARARAGQRIPRVTIAVFDDTTPTRAEIAAARRANVCASTGSTASGANASTAPPVANRLAKTEHVQRALEPKPSASGVPSGSNARTGVLGAAVEKTAETVRPLLVAFLALAILLFAVASLPTVVVGDPRLHHLLAKHRFDIALAGGAALVAVVIASILG